jgi:hypothetical protein
MRVAFFSAHAFDREFFDAANLTQGHDLPSQHSHHLVHGRSLRAGLCTKTSPAAEMSGRPLRIRADHSWPQRQQLYHAMIQLLSGAGSTGRPQTGHDVAAVAGKVVDDMSI